MSRTPAWAIALLVLLLVGYILPYLVLSDVHAWGGTFLFWIVFGSGVWIVLVAAVMRWRTSEAID